MSEPELIVVGGGLAGTEAAWQAAQRGVRVQLYEMRPRKSTPAHTTDRLAELVCSNSLGSDAAERAPGLLKAELRRLGSLLLACAEEAAVPAGSALAVDRDLFAQKVTKRIEEHPKITLIREEIKEIPDRPCIIATGPLTADTLASGIAELVGQDHLFFYDAIAPLVQAETIDMDIAFRASRYARGLESDSDYINCPLTEEEYVRFVEALKSAERIALHAFEQEDPNFFEGCLPVEQLAARDDKALAFGPMRPVGLKDPRTGRRPYAVVQLRQDNLAGSLYNLVGFQTNLRWSEQSRVFRMIPGLQNAEFARFGQMHRNTFVNSPLSLHATLEFRTRPGLFFAGQITGIEGYVGNIGTGLLAGINAVRALRDQPRLELPVTTMLGALCHYIAHANPTRFQPMKANFGLLPPLGPHVPQKQARYVALTRRAEQALSELIASGEDDLIQA
jgi:methylenetetrahydrofolate--tRNA-(uracil-5-)-methyltransferase